MAREQQGQRALHHKLIAVIALLASLAGAASAHKKVLLSDVKVLTLKAGHKTTGRRSSPVPQMQCVGGDACGDYTPRVIQGSDGIDVQWACVADMADHWRFGTTTVSCEGFAYPDDKFVLAGSCGVQYELFRTEKFVRDKQQTNARSWWQSRSERYSDHHDDRWTREEKRRAERGSWLGSIIWTVVLGFIAYRMFLVCCLNRQRSNRDQRDQRDQRDRGRSGFTDSNSPYGADPPPYSPFDEPSAPPHPGPYAPPPPPPPQQQQPQSGPMPGSYTGDSGFWSGFGLGNLTGYLFGSSTPRQRYGNGGYAYPSYTSAGSRWFGGNRGTSYTTHTYRAPSPTPVHRSSSSSSRSSDTTPTTRTATGYGGTTRR
eukprot:jgi/Hompol1/5751/HPOL_002072-RA